MRTTVSIDDHLLAKAKEVAARSGRTLSEVVEDALRESFARQSEVRERRVADFPVFYGGGTVQPGVDLDDNAALLDLMEQDASSADEGAAG